MKCSVLYGGLRGSTQYFIFEKFIWFLGGVKGRVEISDFIIVFKMVVWVRVGFICVQLCIKLFDFYFL